MARHVIPQESLVHGVSQHPKKTRGHLFCERQENCLSSPAIGLTKRPPTNHIAKVTDGAVLPNRSTHVIDRSAAEQYLAMFEHQGCRVLGTDGTEYPVEDITGNHVLGGDSFAYLNLRKTQTCLDGCVGPANYLTPTQAEDTGGVPSLLTASPNAFDGPLGFGKWVQLHATSPPTNGIYQLVPAALTSVEPGAVLAFSAYVREAASLPVTRFAMLIDIGGAFPQTLIAWFDWSSGVPVFDSGSSTAGLTLDITAELEDGGFRITMAKAAGHAATSGPVTTQVLLSTAVGATELYVWGLMLTLGTLSPTAYLEAPEVLKHITIADTTLVTSSVAPVSASAVLSPTIAETLGTHTFVTGVLADITDVLYVQVIQGEYAASYNITVGSTNVDPVDILVETDTSAGGASARNVYEVRIANGAAGLWAVNVLGLGISYTATGSTQQEVVFGLATAINNSAVAVSAVPKYTGDGQDGAVVITADAGGAPTSVALTSKPASGTWTLTETQVETSGVLTDLRTETIAQAFVDKFNALGTSWTDHLYAGRLGSTVYFWSDETITYFDVSDSSGDQLMQSAYKAVPAFSDLPVQAHSGAKIKVSMDAVENEDHIGYFVEYQADHDDIQDGVKGRWVESTDYATATGINGATMPHALVPRLYNTEGDLWDGGSASGTPGTLYWEWAEADWEDRLVGDDTLSPLPGFFDAGLNPSLTLKQLTFVRGRLGFVGGTSVDLSEANRFFNLFRTTTRVLVDADPFNIVASHPKMSVIEKVIPFAERLVLFSEKAQMLLSGDPFSARTVSLEPFVDFVNEPLAEPQVHGNHMWFMYPKARGEWLGVRELFPTTEGIFDDGDRTLQVPSYLPPNPRSFGSDDRGETFIYVSEDARGELYMFKTLADGEDVLQAAWSKFTFASDDLIIGAHVLGKDLFILTERTGGHYLESMDLAEGSVDAGSTYLMRLDRRTLGTDLSPVSGGGVTTFTLPWDIPSGGTVVGRELDGTAVVVDTTSTVTPGSHTVTFVGDYNGADIWIGLSYRAEYEYTTVQPKESSGKQNTTITTGSVQVLRGRFAYENTGHLTVVLQMTDRADVEVPFDSAAPDTPEDGTLEVSVLSPTEQSTVILRSDSPLPFTVLNTEWDADLIARGSRLRI